MYFTALLLGHSHYDRFMAEQIDTAVSVASAAARLPDGVMTLGDVTPDAQPGCRVFVHYNGPTDQLTGMCAGMAVLDPGASRTGIRKRSFSSSPPAPARSNAAGR
jgi:hypothetical protein